MRRLYEDTSFETGNIEIPALGISVDLLDNQFYKQEIVPDVVARENEISIEYGGIPYLEADETINQLGFSGVLTQTIDNSEYIGYYQLIKAGQDPVNLLLNIAHENGHFLFNTDNQDLIYRQLGVENQTHDTEEFAILCQWFGIHRQGYDIASMYPEDSGPQADMHEQMHKRIKSEFIDILNKGLEHNLENTI